MHGERGENVGKRERDRERERERTHARRRWSRGRRVMLDEDENPVECTECIQRTCLQASALTETTRTVPANGGVYPRVGDTNTPQDQRGGKGEVGKGEVRGGEREKRVAAGD